MWGGDRSVLFLLKIVILRTQKIRVIGWYVNFGIPSYAFVFNELLKGADRAEINDVLRMLEIKITKPEAQTKTSSAYNQPFLLITDREVWVHLLRSLSPPLIQSDSNDLPT